MALEVIAQSTLCGFCPTGNHDRCPIGVVMRKHAKYPDGVVWVCPCDAPECANKEFRCTECNNQTNGEVDGETWRCKDITACDAVVTARRDADPLLAKIREARDMAKVTETAKKTTAKKAAAPKTGTCVCGCKGTTKGGKFLPGHDARFVSTLVGQAGDANFTKASVKSGADALKEVGASDALQAKYQKSVGLAQERAEKKEQAAKEREAAKAEKAKA
jgi:hypothetical protein